ncbi:MAG TPA: ATP-binding cassette domain-containing protein, partial [Acidimicrobiia bacterium]|nr:ATP-binding cassette domain-containing protein [Acidimicrobiia bacterium]
LSEGEKKRVILARSLMTEPRLILLDEAYAALDLGARERLVGALANLVRADRSVVVVTHHVEEIPPGFANILMLSKGRVVACGPIGDALTSESLSRTFDLPLEVSRQNGRWRARGAG